MDARERERLARVAQNRSDAAPIVEELVRAGLPVETVADLFNRRLDYRHAIPILLEWLPRLSNQDVKEDVVRALSVKWTPPEVAPLLVREFRHAEDSGVRWAVENALEVIADDSVFDDLVEIVQNQSNGTARQMVVVALGRMKDPRVVDVLLALLHDDEVVGHAIMALGRLKARRARSAIERLSNHPSSWVRKEAKKAIGKIDKASDRLH